LYENKDVNSPIDDYIFDKDGNLRGYTVLENGLTTKTYYKDLQTGNLIFEICRLVRYLQYYQI
jgi:hypothetical protein